jgi:hypothetical protein
VFFGNVNIRVLTSNMLVSLLVHAPVISPAISNRYSNFPVFYEQVYPSGIVTNS